ncbi:hypothetical protein DDB_G0279467 [Dictyostelium discoideum AX4]|uniref:Uncharacterized protein n=1 Tax=Dictyostelium discoideum TaxID=44689 RepID=Q54WS4_DICDI|nr:hypothetical protein DDB_G0279467 [Dictyostelium discoideum AX4]EAL67672.1 hypothetical protein DDB_G0279467 [Dictyostelium discoideum AX4]|eukprot:XP_641643.1 hypothetical protein DDB_G0279467 [Dictyostelium discoideum AX4]
MDFNGSAQPSQQTIGCFLVSILIPGTGLFGGSNLTKLANLT